MKKATGLAPANCPLIIIVIKKFPDNYNYRGNGCVRDRSGKPGEDSCDGFVPDLQRIARPAGWRGTPEKTIYP